MRITGLILRAASLSSPAVGGGLRSFVSGEASLVGDQPRRHAAPAHRIARVAGDRPGASQARATAAPAPSERANSAVAATTIAGPDGRSHW